MRGVAITLEGRPLISYSILGVRGFAHLLASKLHIAAEGNEFDVYPPGSRYPVRLRSGTTDIATYMQIFRDLEYELPGVVSPTTIIDGGANIGLSAVFFAQRYPDAVIIAIEPEETNFRLLKHNVSPYSRVVPLQAALWPSNGTMELVDPGQGKWAYRIANQNEAQNVGVETQRVETVTVDTVMKTFGFFHVDILKMDIEGAEKEVFEGAPAWLSRVRMIAVELHDRFKAGCSRSFYNATNDFDVEWRRGEHVFVRRTDTAWARTDDREIRR